MRQNVDPFTGDIDCIRRRNYPDALNFEIAVDGAARDASADTSDPELPEPRRWCGKWIDARLIDVGQEKWAFFDEADVAWDVQDVILAKGNGRLGNSDLAKFRTACRTMVASNAQGPAGKLGIRIPQRARRARRRQFHRRRETDLGALASHACDAPAAPGSTTARAGAALRCRSERESRFRARRCARCSTPSAPSAPSATPPPRLPRRWRAYRTPRRPRASSTSRWR